MFVIRLFFMHLRLYFYSLGLAVTMTLTKIVVNTFGAKFFLPNKKIN